MNKHRRAIILFNLGGPDSPASVRPFLYNLFSDRAILPLPKLPRLFLAWLIAKRRAREASKIYAALGGSSPILRETHKQAEALQKRLASNTDIEQKVFISMRYWHPRAEEVVAQVKDFNADEVVLLPLYPQYSTTTTQSSMLEWMAQAQRQGLRATHKTICCYPEQKHFLRAHAEGIEAQLQQLQAEDKTRVVILFSAHGLPKSVIARGDPYQQQVEKSCAGVIAALPPDYSPLDWRLCYQSRVGPMAWIGPSIGDALTQIGKEKKGVIVVPIAFVSEHSETLVELDEEYRDFAARKGVAFYRRVAALGTHASFITALASLIEQAAASDAPLCEQESDPTPGRPSCALMTMPPFSARESQNAG